MDDILTLHAEEPTFALYDGRLDPRHPMKDGTINQLAPGMGLPCRADRQKIIEQANLVLAEARVIAEQSDRTLSLLSVEQPAGDAHRLYAASASASPKGTPAIEHRPHPTAAAHSHARL